MKVSGRLLETCFAGSTKELITGKAELIRASLVLLPREMRFTSELAAHLTGQNPHQFSLPRIQTFSYSGPLSFVSSQADPTLLRKGNTDGIA